MALAMSHGEKVDLGKVSSSMAKDEGDKVVSIKAFLEEAKKYSSKMTTLILPDDVLQLALLLLPVPYQQLSPPMPRCHRLSILFFFCKVA
jgi:hypothetical protein